MNAQHLLCCLLPTVLVNSFTGHDLDATTAGVFLATASGAIATGLGYVVWYLALRGPAGRWRSHCAAFDAGPRRPRGDGIPYRNRSACG